MSSLLKEFVNRTDFDSYEDFKNNFDFKVPKNFNFAYDVVDRYAKEDPEKIALIWCNDFNEEKIFTFKDMKKYSDKAANFFKTQGIEKGDAVMLTLKNRFEFWFCIIGLHKIGAIPVPATHMLKTKDIVYRIDKASIKMIVSIDNEELISEYEKAEKELNIKLKKISVGEKSLENWKNFSENIKNCSGDFQRPTGPQSTENKDISILYFSSGTTGQPKMVKHDFRYPLAHIITSKYWHDAIEDGIHHTSADTGWMKAVWGGLYGQWIVGTSVFIYDYDRFDAVNLVEKIEKYKINTFCAPPTIYRFLIKEDLSKYDFSNLKYITTAGEPLNPEVYNKVQEIFGLKLKEGFGQTETVISVANFVWMEPKPGSMGKPAPRFNVELLDTEGNIADIGDEGEICIETSSMPPGLFQGYYRNQKKTDEVWYDGYYHSGDTAWKDEDGFLWFVGRNDDIIKSSGYRIGPFEVESALISHPSVLECAITGAPDQVRGQIVKATIVLTKGYKPSDGLKKELQDHVKKVTAPYKYPRLIEFVDELPKTISGKIRRIQIRNEDKNKS
ncbi:acetyl-coenzyme A synthetase [Methanobrevibacter cuticularis]|uniref:Acetyl-coenzyme A synthetase n=1 Tax=Methanobrevibacter cuticularis TaxID=47311 RepID=A0A166E5P2_9EURY|nr:AMP-binding protein [Methanobrevibacter cuticularis]KZX16306.1 acetyl-coenzyme A synthetase [Methanobrevibacter cuticularis]